MYASVGGAVIVRATDDRAYRPRFFINRPRPRPVAHLGENNALQPPLKTSAKILAEKSANVHSKVNAE